MNATSPRSWACVVLAFALTSGLAARARCADQPPDERTPAGASEQRDRPERAQAGERPELQRFREQMRRHVKDRLERTRRQLGRLEEAERLLESDSPDPARLRALVDGAMGEGRRGGGGGGGGGREGAGSPLRERAMSMAGLDGEPTRPLSPEEREEVLGVFREHAPPIADQLVRLRERSVIFFERTIDSLAPRVRLIRDAKARKDEEMARLRLDDIDNTMQLFRLAFAFVAANQSGDADRISTAERDLRAALGRQFDTRLSIRRLELRQLERRVENMKQELDTIAERREQIIDAVRKNGIPGLKGRPDEAEASDAPDQPGRR
ncbi:MAG: hypothetical protein AB7K52_03465 [Phycisphaerales bacterium]